MLLFEEAAPALLLYPGYDGSKSGRSVSHGKTNGR